MTRPSKEASDFALNNSMKSRTRRGKGIELEAKEREDGGRHGSFYTCAP